MHKAQDERATRSSLLTTSLISASSLLIVLLAWEAAFYFKWIDLTFFPPPTQFIKYAYNEDFSLGLGPDRRNLAVSIVSSFARVLIGLALAFGLAVASGILISMWRPIELAVTPLVRVLAPIAPIAWIPLALTIFGIGNKSAIFLVFMGTYFILVIATISAIEQVDENILTVADALGANEYQKWVYVRLPAALPSVFTMLRINFIGAWMAVLAAEMVGLRDGLGALILIGRESSNPNLILIGMALIGLTGYLIDRILTGLQGRYLWWGKNDA